MIDSKELAKFLHKQIDKLNWRSRGELFQELTPDLLEFWIQQFKTKDSSGHSEWSESYQRNIWIKDEEDYMCSLMGWIVANAGDDITTKYLDHRNRRSFKFSLERIDEYLDKSGWWKYGKNKYWDHTQC